jgi:hypothetical protein
MSYNNRSKLNFTLAKLIKNSMKKFIILFFVLILSILNLNLAFAEEEHLSDSNTFETHKTIEQVLNELRQIQGVTNNADLDCNKINNQQFSEVGEAWMIASHPLEEHSLIHEMNTVDSEESEDLLHIKTGQDYLGCSLTFSSLGEDILKKEAPVDDLGFYFSIVIIFGLIILLVIVITLYFRENKSDKK